MFSALWCREIDTGDTKNIHIVYTVVEAYRERGGLREREERERGDI